MGRLSQSEKIAFLGENCVLGVFFRLDGYKWPRKELWVPISIRSFRFTLILSKAKINRSHPPCFLVTNPSFRVRFILFSVFKHSDLILVLPERDSDVKFKYSDLVFEFWVSIINWALPDRSAWEKPLEQRNHSYHLVTIFRLGWTLLGWAIFERRYSLPSRLKEFRSVMLYSNRLDAVCLLEKREGWHRSMFDAI